MSGWDFGSKTQDSSSGSGKKNFTKFPNGITYIRILDAEPHMRWIHWMPQFKRSVVCPGNCPIDKIRKREKEAGLEYTYNMQRKFSMNIFNHGTDQLEIMDEGITFMEELRDVREELLDEGINIFDVILKVKKRGGDKVSYRIDVDKREPLSELEQEAFESRTYFAEYFKSTTVEQIQALLEVKENHSEKFIEIMTGETKDTELGEEQVETE